MTTLDIVGLIITAAAVFGWFSSRVLRLPLTIGTMLLTVISSVIAILLGHQVPGIHGWAVSLTERLQFRDLILNGLLGLLLFAGAFLLDLESLAREKLAVGLLSVFGTLLSAGFLTFLMHSILRFLGMPAPWLECLLFGALIAPTDPIAVLEMLHRVGIPRNIQAQLAGESLFNDGIGAVLFLAFLDASRGAMPSATHLVSGLVLKSCGGLLLGLILAWTASELMARVAEYQIEILLTLALALGGYAVAQRLHVSAPLEAVAAGLALRYFNLGHTGAEIAHESLDNFWRAVDEIQNAILFVLLGLEVLVIPFSRSTLVSGTVAIAGVTLIRAAVVALMLYVIRLFQRGHESSFFALTWGGLRGGLSIALALSVPEENGRGWILATTYAVVVFSILVQGGTLNSFLERFGPREALS
jgi:CPA1 family monovalent cation:H+ antiporter